MDTYKTNTSNRTIAMTGIIAGACLFMLFGVLTASLYTKPYMPPKTAQKYMEHWLIDSARKVAGEVRLKHVNLIEPFYLHREYQPLWIDNYELNAEGKELLQMLRETSADNWRRYGYEISTIEREVRNLSNLPKQATAVDVLLTDAFITYATQAFNAELLPDMNEGDHPSLRKVAIEKKKKRISHAKVLNILSQSVAKDELDNLLKSMAPSQLAYRNLREALNLYTKLADSGEWYPLPANLRLTLGEKHRLVPHLRWILNEYKDLPERTLSWLFSESPEMMQAPGSNEKFDINEPRFVFDKTLYEALKHFQKRHGLAETGELNDLTRNWINIPPHHMAQKIALNMKRWRHLPENLGKRYVMVNMADYKLQLISNGQVEAEMKVIIGNKERRTPVMIQEMSTLVLAPNWNVPRRIALTSLVPKIKRNPSYLSKKGYRVIGRVNGVDRYISPEKINWNRVSSRYFPYRIVQKPGSSNALGEIKFLFPNDKDIYLHDTSQRQLFNLDKRALSSGCVRVEKPHLLADKLLRGQQGWNRKNIERAIAQSRTTRITLKEKVPVYLMYWTTWIDQNGVLQVRDDIYERDLIGGRSQTRKSLSL